MCLLKFLYYYQFVDNKKKNDELWRSYIKEIGTCKNCLKYSEIYKINRMCYKCLFLKN